MRKVIVLLAVLFCIAGVGLASAAPNVASLSNRGSVIVFPLIDTSNNVETYIKIQNDNGKPVNVQCYWLNVNPFESGSFGSECVLPQGFIPPPNQVATDFSFTLTAYQPIMFAASTGQSAAGDPIPIMVTPFGTGNIGSLYCWAVDDGGGQQISWNFLSGEAIRYNPNFTPPTAYEYSSWNFGARTGKAGDPIGAPGVIPLDGAKFDSTPQYLAWTIPTIGFDIFRDFFIFLVPGKQNFTNLASSHPVTRAVFDVWNENENRYSGMGVCMYCFLEGSLVGEIFPTNPFGSNKIANGNFLTFAKMHTSVARFRVQGKASSACLPLLSQFDQERCLGGTVSSLTTGLLGVGAQFYGTGNFNTTNMPVVGGQTLTDTITWVPGSSETPPGR